MFLLMRLFRSVIGYFLGVFQRDGMEDAAIEEGRSGGPRPCAGPTHAFKISDGPDDSSDTISGELVQVVVVGKTKAGHKPLRKLLSWDRYVLVLFNPVLLKKNLCDFLVGLKKMVLIWKMLVMYSKKAVE